MAASRKNNKKGRVWPLAQKGFYVGKKRLFQPLRLLILSPNLSKKKIQNGLEIFLKLQSNSCFKARQRLFRRVFFTNRSFAWEILLIKQQQLFFGFKKLDISKDIQVFIFAISIVKKVKHLKIFVKSFSPTSLINKEDGINEEYGPNLFFIT